MMVTAFFVPTGLLIYGWTAQYKVFWLVPDIGVVIFGIGMFFPLTVKTYPQCVCHLKGVYLGGIGAMLSIQTYIVDNYQLQAASALAGSSAFRSLAGFGFPLFAGKA